MALDYSAIASTDPTTVAFGDPALQTDPNLPLLQQSVGQSVAPTPDLSQSTVDFNNLGLSGESYVPASQQAAPVPTDPLADPTLSMDPSQLAQTGTAGQGLSVSGQPQSFGTLQEALAHAQQFTQNPQAPAIQPQSFNNLQDALAHAQGISKQNIQSLAAPPPAPAQQNPNDIFGNLLTWEEKNIPAPIRAVINPALQNVAPMGAAIGAGAVAGSVVPGAGTIAGLLVGLGASVAAGFGADWAQNYLADQLLTPEDKAAWSRESQAESQYPVEQAVGSLGPQIATMRFSPRTALSAFKYAGKLIASPGADRIALLTARDANGNLVNGQDLQNLLFLAYGNAQGARNAYQQIQSGNFNPVTFAINQVGSSLFITPRSFMPGAMQGLHDNGLNQAQDAVKAGAKEVDPTKVDPLERSAQLLTQIRTLMDQGATENDPRIQQLRQQIAQIGAQELGINPEESAQTPETAAQPGATTAGLEAGRPEDFQAAIQRANEATQENVQPGFAFGRRTAREQALAGVGPLEEFYPEITAQEKRGNSRPVTADQFQQIARRGAEILNKLRGTPQSTAGMDKNWPQIVDRSFQEAQKEWGGGTIDPKTGEFLTEPVDAYAVQATDRRVPGLETVEIPESALRDPAQWQFAMEEAKRRFAPILAQANHYLGFFHDMEKHNVEIDPVVIVDRPEDAEAIAAATRATGGAYHFATGNGLFPPHVSPDVTAGLEASTRVRGGNPDYSFDPRTDSVRVKLTQAEKGLLDDITTYDSKVASYGGSKGPASPSLVATFTRKDLADLIAEMKDDIASEGLGRANGAIAKKLLPKLQNKPSTGPDYSNITSENQGKIINQIAKDMGLRQVDSGEIMYGFAFPGGKGIHIDPMHLNNVHENFWGGFEDLTGHDLYDQSGQYNNFRNGILEIRQEGAYSGRLNLRAFGSKGIQTAEDYLLKRSQTQPRLIHLEVVKPSTSEDPYRSQRTYHNFSYDDFKNNDFRISGSLLRPAPVHSYLEENKNGIQTSPAGQGEITGKSYPQGESQRPRSPGQAGAFEGQASGIVPSEGSQVGTETGPTTTTVNGTNAAANAAANVAPTNPVTGGGTQPEHGPATIRVSPTTGIARGRNTTDLTAREWISHPDAGVPPELQQAIHSVADLHNVNLDNIRFAAGEAPDIKPVVLTPEELAAKPGDPNYLAHEATPVPSEGESSNFLTGTPVDELAQLLQGRGHNVGPLPVKMNSDAERILLALTGYDGRYFYENSHDAITNLGITPEEQNQVMALLGTYGQGEGVYQNLLDTLRTVSRLKVAGLLGTPEDPIKFLPDLIDNGILKGPLRRISPTNLRDAITTGNIATAKIGPYLRAILDKLSTEFPVDQWMKRLYSGKAGNVKPSEKGRAYEEGRTRYIAKMMGMENPKHAQSAIWVGYKRFVSNYLDRLVNLSRFYYPEDKGIQKLATAASMMRRNVDEADDFQSLLQKRFGINPGDKLPDIASNKTVAKWRDTLTDISKRFYQLHYGSNDKSFLTRKDGVLKAIRVADPKFLNDMSRIWEADYLAKDTSELHSINVLNQDLGPVAKDIAQIAYNLIHEPQGNVQAVLSEIQGAIGATNRIAIAKEESNLPDVSEFIPDAKAMVEGKGILPPGIYEPRYLFDSSAAQRHGGAFFNYLRSNEGILSTDGKGLAQLISDNTLPRFQQSVKAFHSADSKVQQNVSRLLSYLRLARDNPAEFIKQRALSGWAHEAIHAGWARILGLVDPQGQLIDADMTRWAHQLVSGDRALPTDYWELAAKRGLGTEVDRVLQEASGMTLDQHLKYEKGYLDNQKRIAAGQQPKELLTPQELEEIQNRRENINVQDPTLERAVKAIIEDITQLVADHKGVPMSEFTSIGTTDEPIARDFYEPKTREQTKALIGQHYDGALNDPALASQLATEAQTRLEEGGGTSPSNPLRISAPGADTGQVRMGATPATEPVAAASQTASIAGQPPGFERGFTAGVVGRPSAPNQTGLIANASERFASLKQTADTIQSRLDLGQSPDVAGDQNLVDLLRGRLTDLQGYINGLRNPTASLEETDQPKPVRKLPTVVKATTEAAKLPRLANEGDDAYLKRVITYAKHASGKYDFFQSVDDVRNLINQGRPGNPIPPSTDPIAKGRPSPMQILRSMDPSFVQLFSKGEQIAAQVQANEPAPQSPLAVDPEQLHLSLISPVRSTARQGAVSITSKTGQPITPPAINADHFRLSEHEAPSETLAATSAASMTAAKIEALDEALTVNDQLKTELDPDAIQEKAAEIAAAKPVVTPEADVTSPQLAPKEYSTFGMKPDEIQQATERQERQENARIASSYTDSFIAARTAATQANDPRLASVVNSINDLFTKLLGGWDLASWMKDPRTWFQSNANKVEAVQMLYQKVGKEIDQAIQDSDGVRKALDVQGEKARQEALDRLSLSDRAIADLLHNYWQALGNVAHRTGTLQSFLENYFPHLIKAAPGESVYTAGGGRSLSQKTASAIKRMTDEYGQHLYQTVEDLQQHLQEIGSNSTVVTNPGDVFAAHGQGMAKAMLMKQFVNRAWSDFEVQVGKTPGERAKAMGTLAYVKTLPKEYQSQYRTIKLGPMKNVARYDRRTFTKNGINTRTVDLYVHKDLAEQMERLASTQEMGGNVVIDAAKMANRMNTWFKQAHFFLSPMHALSMTSNIGTMTSRNGLFGLPAIFDPTVWKVLKNGENIAGDKNLLYEALSDGVPAYNTLDQSAGEMTGPPGTHRVVDRIPGVGALNKWFEDWMWRKIGYNGTLGLWKHLKNEMILEYTNKNGAPDAATIQAIGKAAAYQAKTATGYLTNLDMSKNWALLGNTAFLANKWTTGQLRTLGDAFNIGPLKGIANPLSKLGGRPEIEGPTQEVTDYVQKKAVDMSRKLILHGVLRLATTSMLMSTALSSLFNNGVPSTPIQNFMKDPLHTFDIYAGRDPQTNKDRWIRLPFYYFQRELADYALSSVKAATEGQDPGSVLSAPFQRFANKANPVSRLGLELVMNEEIGKWLYGESADQASIDSDKQITNLRLSLDSMGIPEMPLEQRILYAVQQMSPTPFLSSPGQLPAPTNDPMAVANALGVGTFLPINLQKMAQSGVTPSMFNVQNLTNMGLGVLGSREQLGTGYEKTPTGEEPIWQAIQKSDQQKQIGDQIAIIMKAMSTDPAVQRNQWAQIEALRQQGGFTPGQLAQIILYGTSNSTNKGILSSAFNPNVAQPPKANKAINGVSLSDQQQVIYDQVGSQREELALAQLMKDPNWSSWDFQQKQTEANTVIQFADKITNEQFALALGTKSGSQISNIQANSMLVDYGTLKTQAGHDLLNSPIYKGASPQDQTVMMQDRMTATQNAIWDKYVGTKQYGYKPKYQGFSDVKLLQAIDLISNARDLVRTTMEQLPSYQTASDDATRNAMLSSALTFADTLTSESLTGTYPRTFTGPLTQQQIFTAVRNGVVLQDEALNALHSSLAYNEAGMDPNTGASLKNTLDNKYIALAHNIALYDMREGFNTAQGQGYQNAIRTQLAADEGYQQLVDSYGGTASIDKYTRELADLKTVYKQENVLDAKQLAAVERNIDNWYYQQHPDYYAFLTARKNWEKYDPVGQAYAASLSSNLGLEAASPVQQYIPPLVK